MIFKKYLATLGICCCLSACVSDTTTLAEGGIGGTGISVGPITGFGSIWQNGVRYDVSEAQFFRDGTPVSGQHLYRIGEIVTIDGSIQSDGVSGKAKRVAFNTKLQGPISAVTSDSLSVLGQTVRLTGLSVRHGFALNSELTPMTMVSISGERNANGIWQANSVTRQAPSFIPGESRLLFEGTISHLDNAAQTFQISGITIAYQSASLNNFGTTKLANNHYVQVRSEQNIVNNHVQASQISLTTEALHLTKGTKLELEGLVTAVVSNKQFALNQQLVQITDATEFEHGSAADIELNTTLEVEGSINELGVLSAKEISIRQASIQNERELEGFISHIDLPNQRITLLGNTLQLDRRTVLRESVNEEEHSMTLAQLRLGDYVEVKASQLANGSLLALQIEREPEELGETELQVKGIATQINATAGSFQVLGVSISTDQKTEFEAQEDSTLTRETFFAQVIAGNRMVEVEGRAQGSGILAEHIKLVDADD